jgi:hypothetical protein
MHYHLSNAQFFLAVFTLILVIIFSAASLLEIRRKKSPPFADYLASEYDREFIKYSAMSDEDDVLSDRRPAFLSFHFRSFDAGELTEKVQAGRRQDRE